MSNLNVSGIGSVGDVVSYEVTDAVTPLSIAAGSGEFGAADVTAKANATSKFIIDASAVLESDLGSFAGVVRDVTIGGPAVSVGLVAAVTQLNVDVVAPATGELALSSVFASYLGLVTSPPAFVFDAGDDPIRVYGGWSGNLWDHLVALCSANCVEMVYDGQSLRVRDIGVVRFDPEDTTTPTVTLNTDNTGQVVEVVNYQTTSVTVAGGTKLNLSLNPSLEANSTGWSASVTGGMTATQGRTLNASAATSGNYSYRTVASSTGSGTHYVQHVVDITSVPVNSVYSVSIAYKFFLVGGAPGTYTTVSAQMVVSGGVDYSLNARHYRSETGGIASTVVFDRSVRGEPLTRHVGEDSVTIRVMQIGVADQPIFGGDDLYVDAALVTPGSIVPFFDGNKPGASWVGAANNSISQMVVGTPTDFYNAFADGQVYSVDWGETVTEVVATNNYPFELSDPTPTSITGTLGGYCVIDSNDVAVPPALWTSSGGDVSTSFDAAGTINLTLTGPRLDIPGYPGPYYFAHYNGATRIPDLSIVGIGVKTDPVIVRLYTGADPAVTSQEVAASIDSPFVDSLETVHRVAPSVLVDAAGPTQKVVFTVSVTKWEGFGVTPGSLFEYDDALYRILSVVPKQDGTVTVTASWHTPQSEIESLWAGSSAATFDAFWAGYSAQQFKIAPLRGA